jgi:hypothetical protein
MHVYMFASRHGASVFGYTGNPTGSNLPAEFSPWQPLGIQVMSGVGGIGGTEIILTAIRARGYYLARTGNAVRAKRSNIASRRPGGREWKL